MEEMALKMKAVCSSKTAPDLYQTAWHYIEEE
jgi:hypothetical protein